MATGISETQASLPEHLLPNIPLLETDGVPLETPWHRAEIGLLIELLAFYWRGRQDYFAGGNMFIYFSKKQARTLEYRGPDFFVVKEVDGSYLRDYWVVWEEDGRYPNAIVELLSSSTANQERTTKKAIYEKTFRTSEYFLYDPETRQLEGWRLYGRRYQAIVPNDKGWLWSEELELWLGLWEGEYLGRHATWLRYYDPNGQLVLTRAEAAEAEATQAKTKTAQVEAELDRLKAWMAAQGISPPPDADATP